MTRPQDREMPTVERRELRFAQPLHDGENRGIDEADVGIGVAIDQFAHAPVVGRREVFDCIGPCFDVGEQGDQARRA